MSKFNRHVLYLRSNFYFWRVGHEHDIHVFILEFKRWWRCRPKYRVALLTETDKYMRDVEHSI